MKAYKLITIITIILAIAVLTVVSIFGIYKKQEFKIVNIAPKYNFGMEFTESIILNLEVDDSIAETNLYDAEGNLVDLEGGEIVDWEDNLEEILALGYTLDVVYVNKEGTLTEENYAKTKDIIISRLNAMGVKQYNIRQDRSTGRMSVEIPNDLDSESIIGVLSSKGTFEIVDSESKEVLINNADIDKVTTGYARMDSGTAVALQIKFNKEGTQKLEDVSRKYLQIEDEHKHEEGEEHDEDEEGPTQPYISILIDGQTYKTTYFSEVLTDGTLSIYTGTATTQEQLRSYSKEVGALAVIIQSGVNPIIYKGQYEGVISGRGQDEVKIMIYTMTAVLAVILVILVAKFRLKGIYAFILGIGYIAALLLLIRLVYVTLTYEGIFGAGVTIILNYIFVYMILHSMKEYDIKSKEAMKKVLIKFSLRLIPMYIMAVIFIFATSTNVNSLGNTLFWGSLLIYGYNFIFTKILLSVTEGGAGYVKR